MRFYQKKNLMKKSNMSIQKYNTFDVESLCFSKPVKNGFYVSKITMNDEPVYIQTPLCTLLDSDTLQIDGKFDEFISEIDQYCVETIINNSMEWFKKQIANDAAINQWRITNYSATMKVTTNSCKFFDKQRQRIDQVEPMSKVYCILQLSKLCIKPRESWCEWKMVQCRIHKEPEKKLKELDFEDECYLKSEGSEQSDSDSDSETEEIRRRIEKIKQMNKRKSVKKFNFKK